MGIEDVRKGDSMNEQDLNNASIDERRLALMLAVIHSLTTDLATTHKLKMWAECPLEMLGHPRADNRLHNEAPKITPKMICGELYGQELQDTLDTLCAGFGVKETVRDMIQRSKRMSANMTYVPFVDIKKERQRLAQKSDYGRKYRQFHKERLAQLQRERRNKFKMTA